ncbi:MAG: LysR family transcriptional regulator, partial [Cyanobacteria bacterium J06576_12]
QPPLSRQIQRLEAKLDVQLFDRSRAQVHLTAAGEVFAQNAQQIMRQMEQGIRDTRLVSQGLMGQLVVAVDGSAFACDRAVQMIDAYQTRWPDLQMQVVELDAVSQFKALRQCEIGLGFVDSQLMRSERVAEDISEIVIVREPLSVVLPSSHVLAMTNPLQAESDSQISLLDIAGEDFVMAASWRDYVRSQAKRHHQITFDPAIIQSVHEYRLMLSFVDSGKGLAIVPASTAQRFSRSDIICLPLQPAIEADVLSVIWRDTQTNPLVAAFVESLTQHATDQLD